MKMSIYIYMILNSADNKIEKPESDNGSDVNHFIIISLSICMCLKTVVNISSCYWNSFG